MDAGFHKQDVTAVKDQPSSISVVIPLYNESKSIVGVLGDLAAFIDSRPDIAWEVIVVDDGSTDGSGAAAAAALPKQGRLISHPENRGYGAALKSGIRAASSEFVLTMDADGQHVAGEIAKLLPGATAFDMTIGERAASATPLFRRPGKAVINALVRLLVWESIADTNSGFRLIKRRVIYPYLHLCSNRFSFSLSSTMAFKSEGHFIRHVPVDVRPRGNSGSNVTVWSGLSVLLLVVRVMMVFHPLRIFGPFIAVFFITTAIVFVWDVTDMNITDATLALLTITLVTAATGFIADQIAHLRRELSSRSLEVRSDVHRASHQG
jgi:glycosyltransferase involved in cell wall biosynthesis